MVEAELRYHNVVAGPHDNGIGFYAACEDCKWCSHAGTAMYYGWRDINEDIQKHIGSAGVISVETDDTGATPPARAAPAPEVEVHIEGDLQVDYEVVTKPELGDIDVYVFAKEPVVPTNPELHEPDATASVSDRRWNPPGFTPSDSLHLAFELVRDARSIHERIEVLVRELSEAERLADLRRRTWPHVRLSREDAAVSMGSIESVGREDGYCGYCGVDLSMRHESNCPMRHETPAHRPWTRAGSVDTADAGNDEGEED